MSFFWSVFACAGWLLLAVSLTPARGKWRTASVVAALAVAVPFAWVVRGLLGDPSYVSGLLAWTVAVTRFRGVAFPGGVMSVGNAAAVLAVEIALVASAVSAAPWDLYYRPGFDRSTLCAMVALGCALFAVRRVSAFTLVVPGAILLGFTGWHESHNAWDGLFDPLLALWAAGVLGARLMAAARRPRPFGDDLPAL